MIPIRSLHITMAIIINSDQFLVRYKNQSHIEVIRCTLTFPSCFSDQIRPQTEKNNVQVGFVISSLRLNITKLILRPYYALSIRLMISIVPLKRLPLLPSASSYTVHYFCSISCSCELFMKNMLRHII